LSDRHEDGYSTSRGCLLAALLAMALKKGYLFSFPYLAEYQPAGAYVPAVGVQGETGASITGQILHSMDTPHGSYRNRQMEII